MERLFGTFLIVLLCLELVLPTDLLDPLDCSVIAFDPIKPSFLDLFNSADSCLPRLRLT